MELKLRRPSRFSDRSDTTLVRKENCEAARSTNELGPVFDRAKREFRRTPSTPTNQKTLDTGRSPSTMPWRGRWPFHPPSQV